jgi:hypothetical protein
LDDKPSRLSGETRNEIFVSPPFFQVIAAGTPFTGYGSGGAFQHV